MADHADAVSIGAGKFYLAGAWVDQTGGHFQQAWSCRNRSRRPGQAILPEKFAETHHARQIARRSAFQPAGIRCRCPVGRIASRSWSRCRLSAQPVRATLFRSGRVRADIHLQKRCRPGGAVPSGRACPSARRDSAQPRAQPRRPIPDQERWAAGAAQASGQATESADGAGGAFLRPPFARAVSTGGGGNRPEVSHRRDGPAPDRENTESEQNHEPAEKHPLDAIQAIRQHLYGGRIARGATTTGFGLPLALIGSRRRRRAGEGDFKCRPGRNSVARIQVDSPAPGPAA